MVKASLVYGIALLAAAATVLLAFAPYGFHLIGLVEEWGIVDTFMRSALQFVARPDNVFRPFVLRPLTFAPFAVAYWLSPTSFLGWQMLLALSLMLKAGAMSSILYRLGRNGFIAVVGAALVIVYPADTMQMTLRALHQLWAIGLSLSGIALILAAMDRSSPLPRIVLALAATVLFLVGGLIYEAGFLLAPAPLLLLWVTGGARRALSVPMAIWIAGLAAAAAYLVLVPRAPGVYQQVVTTNPGQTLATVIGNLPKLVTIGFYQLFLHGWYDGFWMLLTQLPSVWPWAAGAAVLFAAAVALVMRRPSRGAVLKWIAAGLALAALGYAPFLVAGSHLMISQRTFNYAALGGTIALAGVLVAVSARWLLAGKVLALALILVGIGSQWTQVEHYTELSLRQRAILASIVEANPSPAPGKTILVIDKSGSLNHEWMLKGGLLQGALSYLYGQPVATATCVEPGMIWASFVVDAQGIPGRCMESAADWIFGKGLPDEQTIPKTAIDTVVVEGDLSARALVPSGKAAADPALRQRWASILGCITSDGGCSYVPPQRDEFRYDFGRWWSLEEAPWGAGWTEARWNTPAWQPRSISLLMSSQGQLWFGLQPRNQSYQLSFRFMTSPADLEPYIAPKIDAVINGVAIPLTFAGTLARGDVPEGVLRDGLNSVTIGIPFDPADYPYVQFDWVRILPS